MNHSQANRDCFNGAAPARARNVEARPARRCPRWCFNGAAPARARNGLESLKHQIGLLKLQRGRARAGAECSGAALEYVDLGVLQRGRARAGAEWPGLDGIGLRVKRLQRGRARAGAECSFSAFCAPAGPCCFNGAAPARARNVAIVWQVR